MEPDRDTDRTPYGQGDKFGRNRLLATSNYIEKGDSDEHER
jgi:hypothetical protein